jgi:hypothetical protein
MVAIVAFSLPAWINRLLIIENGYIAAWQQHKAAPKKLHDRDINFDWHQERPKALPNSSDSFVFLHPTPFVRMHLLPVTTPLGQGTAQPFENTVAPHLVDSKLDGPTHWIPDDRLLERGIPTTISGEFDAFQEEFAIEWHATPLDLVLRKDLEMSQGQRRARMMECMEVY